MAARRPGITERNSFYNQCKISDRTYKRLALISWSTWAAQKMLWQVLHFPNFVSMKLVYDLHLRLCSSDLTQHNIRALLPAITPAYTCLHICIDCIHTLWYTLISIITMHCGFDVWLQQPCYARWNCWMLLLHLLHSRIAMPSDSPMQQQECSNSSRPCDVSNHIVSCHVRHAALADVEQKTTILLQTQITSEELKVEAQVFWHILSCFACVCVGVCLFCRDMLAAVWDCILLALFLVGYV